VCFLWDRVGARRVTHGLRPQRGMKCADAPGGLRACRTYFVVLIIANCDLAVAWVVLPGVKCRQLDGYSGCSAAQHEHYESNSHRGRFHQRVKRFLKL